MKTSNYRPVAIKKPQINLRQLEKYATQDAQVTGDVNEKCHNWTGSLDPHNRLVMASPGVFAVYWGTYFTTNPGTVALMNQFFTSILGGPYMRGLSQYGVGSGTLLGSAVVEDASPNPLNCDHLQWHLNQWIDNSTVPTPHFNTLYVIFTSPGIELTFGKLSSNTDFGGYHYWGFYQNPVGKATKFFAAIPWSMDQSSPTPSQFVGAHTPIVSHELAEAFTDRDGDGFTNADGCEIGDICETKGNVIIDGWEVERYWSDIEQACVPKKGTVQPLDDAVWVALVGSPQTVKEGSTFTISVTFRNTGTGAWSTSEGYQLATVKNDSTWGNTRFPLPGTANFPTSSEVTFNLILTAPTGSRLIETSWQMIHEPKGSVFGEQVLTTVSVQPASLRPIKIIAKLLNSSTGGTSTHPFVMGTFRVDVTFNDGARELVSNAVVTMVGQDHPANQVFHVTIQGGSVDDFIGMPGVVNISGYPPQVFSAN